MSENNQKEQLAELRHSAAHLLAAAVLGLYPKAKLAIGPSIDEGFYYDIDFGTESLGDEQLESIENKMRELVPNWQEFKREEVSAEQAKRRFAGNPYKLELI
ncbi:MAG TPA: threonine--tRNA ligase, partial [Candidatus Woesebacteria bacterium]|nr:threonine--tRNA ligase [Candidatus Woesebacteria bacterium]